MINEQILKERLLNTHYFIDNIYLDEYIKLILKNEHNINSDNIHHIIPKLYYKHFRLVIDDSQDNLVKLSYKDHCRAHFLISKCSLDFVKKNNNYALRMMVSRVRTKNIYELTEDDFNQLQVWYEESIIKIDKFKFIDFYKTHSNQATALEFKINRKLVSDSAIKYNCSKRIKIHLNENKTHITKEELKQFYIINNHTLKETAKYFNVDKTTVIRDLKKYGINQSKNKFKHDLRKDYNHNIDIKQFKDYAMSHTNKETCKYFNISDSFCKQLINKYKMSKRINNKDEIYNFYTQFGLTKTLMKFKVAKSTLYRIKNSKERNHENTCEITSKIN